MLTELWGDYQSRARLRPFNGGYAGLPVPRARCRGGRTNRRGLRRNVLLPHNHAIIEGVTRLYGRWAPCPQSSAKPAAE